MYKIRDIRNLRITPYKMPALEGSSNGRSGKNPLEPKSALTPDTMVGVNANQSVQEDPSLVIETGPTPEQIKLDLEEMERQARQKAVLIEKEAYQKGLQKGIEEGEKTGLKNAQDITTPMIEHLSRLIEDLKTFRTKSLEGLQPQVVELAVGIAKKIIGEELSVKPELIISIVKEALMRIDKAGHITIKVNPAVYDLIIKHKDNLLDVHSDVGFEVDTTVSQKGPVVASTTEEISTDIDELFYNAIEDMRDNLVLH
ncbi:MAG: hypothetical protein HQL06_02870 [Nitrospirae bacterium]|nr:hypothetical protein [Nitrospirota bacterium]